MAADEQAAETPGQRTARRIAELRNRRGWSAQRLADEVTELTGETLTRATLATIESGRREARIGEIWAIAAALGVSPLLLVATHPGDPGLDLGTTTVPAVDAIAWEAGAGPINHDDATTFATDAADAWGPELLTADRQWLGELRAMRSEQARAESLADTGYRVSPPKEHAALGKQADRWSEDHASRWRTWVDDRPSKAAERRGGYR